MNNKECCKNCKYYLKLLKWDYSHGGCEHSEYEGFACIALANEGVAIHIVHSDNKFAEENDYCEMFTPKEKEI